VVRCGKKPLHLTTYQYFEQEPTKQKAKSTASQRKKVKTDMKGSVLNIDTVRVREGVVRAVTKRKGVGQWYCHISSGGAGYGMARKLSVEYPGAIYHLMNRGKCGWRSGCGWKRRQR